MPRRQERIGFYDKGFMDKEKRTVQTMDQVGSSGGYFAARASVKPSFHQNKQVL